MEEIKTYFFNEYPPTEILEEDAYKESLKRLSFSYRTVQNDELIAFIALKKKIAHSLNPSQTLVEFYTLRLRKSKFKDGICPIWDYMIRCLMKQCSTLKSGVKMGNRILIVFGLPRTILN